MLSIESASYFVPKKYINLINASEVYGLTKNEIKVFTRVYGLEKIPIADDMSLRSLLYQSLNQLNMSSVCLIIFAHTSKVVAAFSDPIIHDIKRDYHLSDAVGFGMTINNCASTLSAFEVADHYLQTQSSDKKALIITGELTFTSVQKVIPRISILGDASAAVLVSRSNTEHRLLSVATHIDGASADGVWMTPEQNQQYERDYAPTFSAVIHDAVNKAGIALTDVAYIFPHNVNIPAWTKLANVINFPIEKIYLNNIKRYSHCFGADIIINFVDAIDNKNLKSGDYYMLATVGLGSIYSAAVFQY